MSDTEAAAAADTPVAADIAAPDTEAAAAADAVADAALSTTVQMVRDEPQFPNGPVTADVHPDEVANWAVHGWRPADGAVIGTSETALDKPLDAQSFAELRKTAKELGIPFTPKTKADELKALIAAKQAEAANG